MMEKEKEFIKAEEARKLSGRYFPEIEKIDEMIRNAAKRGHKELHIRDGYLTDIALTTLYLNGYSVEEYEDGVAISWKEQPEPEEIVLPDFHDLWITEE